MKLRLTHEEKITLSMIGFSAALLCLGHWLTWPNPALLVYYGVAYLLVGGEVVVKACRNIIKGQVFDENFLMVVATVGAFMLQQYPEAVAVMLFYQLGEFFQDRAVANSRQSITALMDLRPDYANLELNGQVHRVRPEQVQVGDVIVVHPGEKVPVDGCIVAGQTYLNTAALTGESQPQYVTVGDDVLSGTIVQDGVVRVSVTKEFGASTASQILELVEHASEKKTVTENFIQRFAKVYTPIVVVLAALLTVVPPLVTGGAWAVWIQRALIFLVISCPCALVISIPLGFFGGLGAASKAGALIKGSNFLEALAGVKTVVYDKTGTLTQGEFAVVATVPHAGVAEADLIRMAALAETASPHPIAQSIVAYARLGHAAMDQVQDRKELVGQGVRACYQGQELLVGKRELLLQAGIILPQGEADLYQAGTRVYVAYDGQYQGLLVVADVVKPDSAATVAELRSLGITKQVMLTGDVPQVGQALANELRLDEVHCSCLPQDKVAYVDRYKQELAGHAQVAFVGDGLNDTPVLTSADVGIAMGGLGSDAAIGAADVVLMHDDPSSLVKVVNIARKTKRIVWENIIFALGCKLLFLVLGALGLTSMWAAVFADVGVTVIAVVNSLRLLHTKDKQVGKIPPRPQFNGQNKDKASIIS
ncbi:heavy metal translocating P-type ATPase [Ligilactobacillus saerimneri]|uniref:heavy metal translocating P-type ATPase n=1 Tax=Ligilactobacillus saerimneri TaxID=228229 RepID=UPI000422D765|nr:heavy metal translocating P-type ATPase [Ligilactobacillus saerimneri]